MSDPVAVAAFGALDQAISTIPLPAPPPNVSHQLRVLPILVRPLGIGGYAGEHRNPRGAIHARRVQATLDLRVQGGAASVADDYLSTLIGALLTQSEAELRGRGIARLNLRDRSVADPRSAQFDLRYDYRHLPTAGEGVIETLDVGLDTNLTPYRARYRFDVTTRTLAATPQPLADFVPTDDIDLDPPPSGGIWSYDLGIRCIVQTAAARGGAPVAADPRKAGTVLLWRPGGTPLALARFMAVVEFESVSPQGVGLVFGHTGVNDRWHFLASQANGYHLFGRKAGAAWGVIGAPASSGLAVGQRHVLTLTVFDQTLRAAVDGVQTLEVHSDAPVPAGEIGFFTHGNDSARLHRVRLLELV